MAKRRTERGKRKAKARARRQLEGPPVGLSKYAMKKKGGLDYGGNNKPEAKELRGAH
jgi:hypothetical protein